MKQAQHPIDLLPEALRARVHARASTGRNIVYALLGMVVVSVTAAHARVAESRAEHEFTLLKSQADELERNEIRAKSMQADIDLINAHVKRYGQVALPLEVSRVLLGVIDALPEAAAADKIEIQADQIRRQTPYGRVPTKQDHRLLFGEVAGFARNDLDVAGFVGDLDQTEPFQDVSLDFSRQRMVNEITAREFRLSFTIDLSRRYEVLDLPGGREQTVPIDVD